MNFLSRIGYGWLLLSESFFSIFKQHTNLVKAAALLCVVPFVLFLLFGVPAVAFTSWSLLVLSWIAFFVLFAVLYIIYAALYEYFAAFVQERRLTLKAAFRAVMPYIGYILLWLLIDSVVRNVFERIANILPSWSYTLSQAEVTNGNPITTTAMVSIRVGDLLKVLWSLVSFFVLPSIVLDSMGIIEALRVSATLAFKKLPEFIGFVLWNIVVGIWPVLCVALILAYPTPALLRTFVLYGTALFFATLVIAYALFTVVLYLSSTGRSVSGFSPRLQQYLAQQSGQDTMPTLQE